MQGLRPTTRHEDSTRSRLRKYRHKRKTFIATLSHRGLVRSNGVTVCLTDVTLDDGTEITDHAWIVIGEGLADILPRYGTRIRFSAEVQQYFKGRQPAYGLANVKEFEKVD